MDSNDEQGGCLLVLEQSINITYLGATTVAMSEAESESRMTQSEMTLWDQTGKMLVVMSKNGLLCALNGAMLSLHCHFAVWLMMTK